MKQATRVFIAAAAVATGQGRRVARVYDYSEGKACPFTPVGRAPPTPAADSLVVCASGDERVSLEVHDDLFTGMDHRTGAFFAGAIDQSDVMLYDGSERRYYKFLAAAAIHSLLAPPAGPLRGCRKAALSVLLAAKLVACGGAARLPESAGIGPNPTLPPPQEALIPVMNIAPAKGWPAGGKPLAAEGTAVASFAAGLDHPRWLYVLPNGDVLVAETNAPARPEQGKGIKGWVKKRVMKKAGAATPSANRITLLRDTDGDGVADTRSIFLAGLNSPFGMALVGNDFYVANTNALVRFPYALGETQITEPPTKVVDLPGGPLNHHWTKNVMASADGTKLYATVGSNSNVAENGIDKEKGRAAIWEVDPKTGAWRVFASGLRNPNGLAWESESSMLWTVVNERDEIGSDLVPDYMTAVREGGFYGWPYSYFGQHVDPRVKPQRPELVAKALRPDYALGAHTASLGLAYSAGTTLPARFQHGMFVAQHGSWNRKPLSGYKVIFVPFTGGKPSDDPVNVLTGFVNDEGEAFGRPVGVAIDKHGALLVADDVGNVIWRVTTVSGSEDPRPQR